MLFTYLIIECNDVDIYVIFFLYTLGKYIIGVNASIFLKMISKFLRISYKYNAVQLLTGRVTPQVRKVRYMEMIPASQYDLPYPNRLKLGYVLKHNWEIIPLFISTCVSLSLMFFTILWSCKNKVSH